MKVAIKNNSKHGYLLAEDGDGIDLGVGRANHRGSVKKGISHTLKAEMDAGVIEIIEAKRIGGLFDTEEQKHQAGAIWDKEGLSPNIDTMQGGYRQPLITEPKLVGGLGEKKSNGGTQYYQQDRIYDANEVALCQSAHGEFNPWYAVAMRGRDGEQKIEPSNREEANAITTVQKDSMAMSNMRIRKLTPKECWRLMGWDDESFAKAESVNSNSQLYKQAGNGIVVNCFAAIIKNLL